MLPRSMAVFLAVLILLAGAVALWAADEATYPPGTTSTQQGMMESQPGTMSQPGMMGAQPGVAMPTESYSTGGQPMVQSEFQRCTQTCNNMIVFYNQTYPTMRAREGDSLCWQSCWDRYHEEGGRIRRSMQMGRHDRIQRRMLLRTGGVVPDEANLGQVGPARQYPEMYNSGVQDAYVMRQQSMMEGGYGYERDRRRSTERASMERREARMGMRPSASEMKAFWAERRPNNMRANMCAQACWRMHHNDDRGVSVGGFRSEPRPLPWSEAPAMR